MDDPLGWVEAQTFGDPVRLRVLQALARRAAKQPPGALRERLVAKLMQRAEGPPAPLPARQAPNAPSPLTPLLARLQAGAGPELRNVQAHRRTWGQLRLDRRMAEVSAPVSEHLGPLNNRVLVTRALQQLKSLSPDYLQHLLAQLDGLAALAPLQAYVEPEPRPTRPAAKKTAARRR